MTMRCKLCQRQDELVDSHIIPKFVANWLKETSATGFLRQATHPNLRRQDLPTQPLLCRDCEERFSIREKQFSETIFLPYHEEGKRTFEYQEWLLYFAISIIWRIGITQLESFRNYKPHLVHLLERALGFWSDYLLGNSLSPGPYSHHLLFLDFVADIEGGDLPEGFHWYILRGIDATIPASSKEVYVYGKLPGMVFFSGVHPARPSGWKNTRILRRGKISASHQVVTHDSFGEFLIDRVMQSWSLLDKISDRQEQRIAESVRMNPLRSLQSRSLQVYLAEQYWRKRTED